MKPFLQIIALLVFTGCAGLVRYDRVEDLKKIEEFDSRVQIEIVEEAAPLPPASAESKSDSTSNAPVDAKTELPTVAPEDKTKVEVKRDGGGGAVKGGSGKSSTKASSKNSAKGSPKESPKESGKPPVKTGGKGAGKSSDVAPPKRLPEYEDSLGFDGRRPIKDPFRVGEKIVHDVTYFGVSAGNLIMEVKPFALVNGRKSYNFRFNITTSSLFSSFYSVDDHVTVLMDFERLVPSVYKLHVNETGQLRETRMLIEQEGDKFFAQFWEKKFTQKNGEEKKHTKWEVPEYSQNVFSAVMYTRVFQWRPGVEYAFSVADTEENNLFRGKVIRREKLKTAVGEFDTVVIQPQVELKGKLKPVGENYIWLSDDDRKFILRIESKIKIGTLVSEVIQLDRGRE